jgi:hypothetical protein
VELEALRRLIRVRGGVDRETLQMTCRVLQHTRFRARQVRDAMVEQVSQLMLDYAEAMGGPERCDAAVLDLHFEAIKVLLATPETDVELAANVLRELDLAVLNRMARPAKVA